MAGDNDVSQFPKGSNSFFLIVIGEVKIRTTNPSFFASVRRLDFSRNIQLWGKLKIMGWCGKSLLSVLPHYFRLVDAITTSEKKLY
jgi:hypothetical protein